MRERYDKHLLGLSLRDGRQFKIYISTDTLILEVDFEIGYCFGRQEIVVIRERIRISGGPHD